MFQPTLSELTTASAIVRQKRNELLELEPRTSNLTNVINHLLVEISFLDQIITRLRNETASPPPVNESLLSQF